MDKLAEAALKMKTASLGAQELQSLGRTASKMYLCQGVPLEEAITKVARECGHVTAEQVMRMTEAANNATFLSLFEKQAGNKYVEFDHADPREVLRAMDVEARPAVSIVAPDFYSSSAEKLGSRDDGLLADLQLADMFGVKLAEDIVPGGRADDASPSDFPKDQIEKGTRVEMEHTDDPELAKQIAMDHLSEFDDYYDRLEDMEEDAEEDEGEKEAMLLTVKTAGAGYEKARTKLEKIVSLEKVKKACAGIGQYREENPYGDIYRTRDRLVKLSEDARSAVDQNGFLLKTAADTLTHHIKQHILNGGNVGELAHAMNEVGGYDLTKLAMETVVPRLDRYVLKPGKVRADAIFYEMSKSASSRVINPDNPILIAFADFAKAALNQEKLASASSEVDGLLRDVNVVVAKAMRRQHASSM